MKNIMFIASLGLSGAGGYFLGKYTTKKYYERVMAEEIAKQVEESRKNQKEYYSEKKKTAEELTNETRYMSNEEFHEFLQKNFVTGDPDEEDDDYNPNYLDDDDDYEGDEGLCYKLDEICDEMKEVLGQSSTKTFDDIDIVGVDSFDPDIEIIYGEEAGRPTQDGDVYTRIEMEYYSDGLITEDPYAMTIVDAVNTVGHDALDFMETHENVSLFIRNHRLREDIELRPLGETYEEMLLQRPWVIKKAD